MALKGLARQTTGTSRVAEGKDVYLKLLRDGTLSIADWVAALSLEGRVFTANGGIQGTDITFGDGGLGVDEYDLFVSVPSGICIIPLSVRVLFSVWGAVGGVEVVMQSGTGGITGSGNSVIPTSSNLNTGNVSACTVTSAAATGATQLQANIKELWRDGVQRAITMSTVTIARTPEVFTWEAKDAGALDIVGPSAQLAIWAASSAGQGYITLKYIELPAASLE